MLSRLPQPVGRVPPVPGNPSRQAEIQNTWRVYPAEGTDRVLKATVRHLTVTPPSRVLRVPHLAKGSARPVQGSSRSWTTTSRSRKIICSANAIESLNARYRRAVRARGHFPTELAGRLNPPSPEMPLPRDPIAGPDRPWQDPMGNEWKPALNAVAITLKAVSSLAAPTNRMISYTQDLTDPPARYVADPVAVRGRDRRIVGCQPAHARDQGTTQERPPVPDPAGGRPQLTALVGQRRSVPLGPGGHHPGEAGPFVP
jgi:hypothetical protein